VTHPPRHLPVLVVLLLAAGAAATRAEAQAAPYRHLYVWAGMGHHAWEDPSRSTAGPALMVVLNADPSSPRYGAVEAALTVDPAGRMPHHTEVTAPARGPLFANDYFGDRSFLVDFSRPESPRLAGRVARVPGGRQLHSFERLRDGHVLATVQFSTGGVAGHPGGLAEFDARGRLVRTAWSADSAFPGARIRTYALAVLPAADRVVTTSAPMETETTANVVQVWRLSDLKLLKTLPVPQAAGDSADVNPFEVRALADGSVLLNTYTCGLFHITGLVGTPRIERVLVLRGPKDFGCSVPAVLGHFMVLPIAYAHRYAVLDIADPLHPREVGSLPTDTTFFPHWTSPDPGSDRIVVTDQGDGKAMVRMLRLDRATGRLTWDERFRDAGAAAPGVSFDRASWPNGAHGMAMPHGAVFVP
jgi:hypothetical protein